MLHQVAAHLGIHLQGIHESIFVHEECPGLFWQALNVAAFLHEQTGTDIEEKVSEISMRMGSL